MIRTTDEAREAAAALKELLPAGAVVYGVIRSRSQSGAQRRIEFLTATGDRIVPLNRLLHQAMGWRLDANGYAVINGGGMDMIHKAAYDIGLALHGDGYALRHEAL